MKFYVTCEEMVKTEFIVESPSRDHLLKWLETKGADAVSEHTQRQQVSERSWSTTVRAPEVEEDVPDYTI